MADNLNSTDQIIAQGRALVRAIEALNVIEPSDYFEGHIAELLAAAYERRLEEILAAAPTWVGEKILSARSRCSDF